MYRVYVPQVPAELQGNVPLPQVTLQSTSGETLASYGACGAGSVETGGALNEAIAGSNWPEGAPAPQIPGATNPPTWARTSLSNQYAGLFANQQNAYLTAKISRQYGSVVVIHGKAPTFPDTRAGQPAYAKRQVRYWSICENSDTTRVISCAADYDAALTRGYYTYVISEPDQRPGERHRRRRGHLAALGRHLPRRRADPTQHGAAHFVLAGGARRQRIGLAAGHHGRVLPADAVLHQDQLRSRRMEGLRGWVTPDGGSPSTAQEPPRHARRPPETHRSDDLDRCCGNGWPAQGSRSSSRS